MVRSWYRMCMNDLTPVADLMHVLIYVEVQVSADDLAL